MNDFTAAERRAYRLARRLISEGKDAGIVADAFAATAAALFSAHHGTPHTARSMLQAWSLLREAADHG
ncbi:hypothetical protein [Chelativorans alearense]|uniref:hypothetical protein n=1 Tax=Chelativorans alearense TaxID=2681495 RepID=UPI0013CF5056|nr:hypothetical protein [Chelativorans alearense]